MAVSNNPVTNRLLKQKKGTASAAKASTSSAVVSNNAVTQRLLGNTPTKAELIAARKTAEDNDIAPVGTTTTAIGKKDDEKKPSTTKKSEPNLNINAFGANADAHKQTGNMLSAAVTGFFAPIVEAGAQTSNAQLAVGEQARLALEGKTTEAERQEAEREKKAASKEKLFAKSDALAQKSAEQTELAKEGKGKVGQFMVDLGIAGTQLLGDVALSAAVPGLGTLAMGTRAFGGAAKEARDAGASENQQQIYGLANMAVSLGVEKLFQVGKVFKKAYGDGVADDVFEKLADKLLKSPAGQSILAGFLSEGSEEAIEAALSPLLQRIYDNNAIKQFDSKEAWTEYGADILYNFLLGGTLGAVGGAGNVNAPAGTTAEAQNTPVTPKITENDQKVIDKLVADRIAEAEKDGKKLTNKEKNKLYDSVVEDMDKGRISIDTIEEVLGGDTYKSYRETVDSEDALTKEFEELGNKQNATLAEQSRYNELKQQIEDMKKNSQRDTLKTKLSEEVFGIAKDSRLAESYAERDRRGQAYEADLTQYDEKQKATIQNAINSGILNNTRRTHEFVDLIAKISADKGVPFDFTNNEKLKGSSFAVDGKTVNGYVTKDGVTLNIDSAKALNSVVGHEITHVLEGTELYAELQTAVMEYAKSTGDYQSRYDALTKLYEGVEGADVDAELTADLVGDYLFTDENFIKNLAANKTVFQKIYDEIKYLCKVATAGSKEARQLEKVKRAFEKAYQENGKAQSETKQTDGGNVWSAIVGTKKATEGGTKYSISETTDGRFAAVVDNDILANIDTSVWDNTKKEAAKKAATEALKQFKDGIVVDGITRKVNRRSRREYTRSKDTEKLFNQKTDVFADKMRAAEVADDIVVVATDWNRDGYLKHPRTDNFVDFDHGKTLIVSGDAKYSAEVVVGITDAGEAVFYDVVDMTPTAFDIKKEELPTTATTQNAIGDIQGSSFDASVPQSGDDVKRSLSDSDYLAAVERVDTETAQNPKNEDIRFSMSEQNAEHPVYGNYNVYGSDVALAPVVSAENATTTEIAPVAKESAPIDVSESPVLNRLNKKLSNSNEELENNKRLRDESNKSFDEKIAKAQAELDAKANKDTQEANAIKRRIERLQRLKADRDAEYAKRISDISARVSRTEENIAKYHPGMDRAEKAVERIDKMLEYDKAELEKEYNEKQALLKDKSAYISSKASELYDEIRNLKKGVRASALLGELLDSGYEWSSIRSALTNIKYTPDQTVNVNSAAESRAREILNEDYENSVYNLEEDYAARVKQLEDEAAKKRKSSTVAYQRKKKQQEYYDQMAALAGDTSTWVDKKQGIYYRTNTLKRNLRDIVRDAKGNRDIAKADAIYNELQGKYNTHEAMLNRESTQIKQPYADMKITKAEDEYIQMLGEFRHNPDTTLTEDVVKEFYEKHKKDIDTAKVDKAIEMARQTYDELLIRVNNVLREQGMKEIPYRKGYFPHFTEEKQNFLAKLFNWRVRNNDIPTDIAGLTENFNPNRSWQSFNKQRKSDITDYSFTRGMDTYVQGALDWVYHIEDIQKRRAFENYIRYIHSDKGVQEKIDAIKRSDEYDADEAQEQIDLVLNEAGNPLNNFVTDLRAGTNTLANKKSSLDRTVEELTSRKFYSVMTNVSNRVSANMVGGSVSSALTNFIPITQSWGEVSPISSLRAMVDTLRSTFRDDGMVNKSDFLTNRLRKADNLYKTGWDKVSDKVGLMMEAVDSFTSQTVWRSRYLENISKGMSESEAITNADQFAESVMAGRSRGNMPTIFDSKNPLVKTLTAFQLEVANQYGYMFKDMPQDMKNESVGKLVKGYATMFLGAYAYNALYSALTGRDAAFDPIGIIEELLRDLGLFGEDEEEEPVDTVMNLAENVFEEVPFVGGLLGGGRIPISSAIPYDGNVTDFIEGASKLVLEGDTSDLTTEWLKPVYYMALPMGGGQIKKSAQGLAMFSDDHPVAGSYTKSGNLRFPVEDTIGNRIKAGIFGQYASKNAREYFDNNLSPLKEKQIQEYIDSGMDISEYRAYRKGLAQQETVPEKLDYIASLDLPISTKNILANNAVTRKNPINMADYE